MDSLKQLVETHQNLRKIEQEVNKCRITLMKEYQNRSNHLDSLFNYLSIWKNYQHFTNKMREETEKFDQILSDSIIAANNDENNNNNNEYNEIMTNIENFMKDSEISISPNPGSIYDDSMSSIIQNSVHSEAISITESKQEEQHKQEVDKKEEEEQQQQQQQQQQNKQEPDDIKDDEKGQEKEKKDEISTTTKQNGYVYHGNGAKIFSKLSNNGKPVFTSTILYCSETCNLNKKKIVDFLIKNGCFTKDMIEQIYFKRSWKGKYALIRTRGSLKIIQEKIQKMNENIGEQQQEIINIFQRNTNNDNNNYLYINPSSVLYVNNFDLFGSGAHKALTKLFLRFGDLKKHIKLGLDKYGDPFAMVQFINLEDATKCLQTKDLKFGGRFLNVQYSKY